MVGPEDTEDWGRGGGVVPRANVDGTDPTPGDAVWARDGALEGGGGSGAGAVSAVSPAFKPSCQNIISLSL